MGGGGRGLEQRNDRTTVLSCLLEEGGTQTHRDGSHGGGEVWPDSGMFFFFLKILFIYSQYT